MLAAFVTHIVQLATVGILYLSVFLVDVCILTSQVLFGKKQNVKSKENPHSLFYCCDAIIWHIWELRAEPLKFSMSDCHREGREEKERGSGETSG